MLCRHIIMMAADAGSPSLLILLDLTAAFDTVDVTPSVSLALFITGFHPTLLGEWNMLPWERLNP